MPEILHSLPSLPLGGDADGAGQRRDAHVARAEAARQRRADRQVAERAADYAAMVHRVAYRFAFKRFGGDRAADIAQVTVLKFCADSARFMAEYPDPQKFAVPVARNTGIDLARRERAQRGEGANLRTDADGQLVPARRVDSIDGDSYDELGVDPLDLAEFVVSELELDDVLALLEPLDREILELHVRKGYKVGEIAAALDMVSSTVSRRLAKARALVAEFLVAP